MTFDGFDDTVDKIYEAGVVSERWANVLTEVGCVTDCKGGELITNPTPDFRGVASDDLAEVMTDFTRGGWAARNSRAMRLAALRHPGFVTDLDIFTPEELAADPFYLEFLRPRGLWHAAGTMVYVPNGDLLVFSFERAYGGPPIEREAVARLDQLRPHLARAALISARLGLERAHAMVQSLEAIGLPAAAFRRDGRVLATNVSLEALDTQFIARACGRLAAADPAANTLLSEALQRAAVGTGAGGTMSFPVPATKDRPALIAHLVPVKRAAHDIFTGAVAILVITPLAAPQAPSEDLLNGPFDLTPAEARVCRAIVEGQTVASTAANLGIQRETVRGHLKSVLAKTGTGRQAELVRLLVGKQLPFSFTQG